MNVRDDAELLRLYAETRSEDAFAEFVRRYVDLVYSTAVRCAAGDAHLAKDITQSVFIILTRQAGALVHHRALEGWLYTTTRYEANHAVRREQRRRLREQKAQTMHELHSPSAAEPDWQQLRPLIDDSMGRLSAPDREAVLMRFFLHRSFREISVKLGLSEDAARRRVERALQKLHVSLTRRGIASSTAAVASLLSTQAVMAAPPGMAAAVAGAAVAASGGATAAFHLLHFMSTTKFLATAACVALLAMIGTAVREHRVRAEITTSLATEIGRLETAERAVEAMRRRARAQKISSTPSLAHPVSTLATSRPAGLSTAPKDSAVLAGDNFLAEHPEAQKLWDDREKAALAAKAAPLYRSLRLTTEQIAAFEDLLLQGQRRNLSVNTPEGPIILHAEPKLPPEEFEHRARDLLGDRGWEQARAFGRLSPAYDITAQLASAVYRSEPLSSAQIDQVTQALADASASFRRGGTMDRSQIDWASALVAARPVLSAGQSAALAALQPQTEFRQSVKNLTDPGRPPSAPPPSP